MTDAVVAARSESIRKLTNLKSPVPADIDVAQAARASCSPSAAR